jgi:hypothetical protein
LKTSHACARVNNDLSSHHPRFDTHPIHLLDPLSVSTPNLLDKCNNLFSGSYGVISFTFKKKSTAFFLGSLIKSSLPYRFASLHHCSGARKTAQRHRRFSVMGGGPNPTPD